MVDFAYYCFFPPKTEKYFFEDVYKWSKYVWRLLESETNKLFGRPAVCCVAVQT